MARSVPWPTDSSRGLGVAPQKFPRVAFLSGGMFTVGRMRIGELASTAGTTTKALRYYEERGLLDAPRRTNGYRDYDESHLRVVREIQTLREIGFALEDTRPFVDCLRAGHAEGDSCPDAIAVYRRKIAEVEAYLAQLNVVRDELRAKLADAHLRRREGN
jgi:DNA-binding transcriptional MerR regulator